MTKISLFSPYQGKSISLLTDEQKHFAQSGYTELKTERFDWLNLVRNDQRDFSLPKEIRFMWRVTEGELISATLECAEDPDFTSGLLCFRADLSRRIARAHSLKTGTRYFWRVRGIDRNRTQIISETRSFTTEPEAPRWILADGVSNVRDCGAWLTKKGQPLRQGLLIRGGEMNSHMTIKPDAARFLEHQLGVKAVLDIRGREELARLPSGGPALSPSVKWFNIPLRPYTEIFTEEQTAMYARAFRLLLDTKNLPMYVHCWGGADRTGTFVLLVNAVLGLDDESLILDYELTSLAIWRDRSRFSPQFSGLLAGLESYAPGKSLEEKACAYLKSGGITDQEIRKLKQIFISK